MESTSQPGSGTTWARKAGRLLYPRLERAWLPVMLHCALCGALLAGIYGVLHDQATYSIGPEYFTRLKFAQFHYADFGWPRRVFVAEVGFLATWWVGFVAGWFLARIAVPVLPRNDALRRCAGGFAWLVAGALGGGLLGWVMGLVRGPDYTGWEDLVFTLEITDLPAFVRVAYIHNAGYAGRLIGLVIALVRLRRLAGAQRRLPGLSG